MLQKLFSLWSFKILQKSRFCSGRNFFCSPILKKIVDNILCFLWQKYGKNEFTAKLVLELESKLVNEIKGLH